MRPSSNRGPGNGFSQAVNPSQAYHSAAARLLLFQNASYVTPYNVTVLQITQVRAPVPHAEMPYGSTLRRIKTSRCDRTVNIGPE